MTAPDIRRSAIQLIARHATASMDAMTNREKVALLEALSIFLPSEEGEQALLCAAAIRSAQEAQLIFTEMLQEPLASAA